MKSIFIITCAFIALTGCKKTTVEVSPLASLKIVNAVTGGSTVMLNSYRQTVANNAATDFSLLAGNPDIYVWPLGDSLNPYFNANKGVTVKDREIYTLFLGGSVASKEAILIKESLPVRKDSTAGIRFVNLSPGSPAVKITLSTSSTVSEFGEVNYKGITEFKSYPALIGNTSYTFQVRNASTDALITSITMSGTAIASFVPRFRNVTLVLRGVVSGSPAAGITRVNHY